MYRNTRQNQENKINFFLDGKPLMKIIKPVLYSWFSLLVKKYIKNNSRIQFVLSVCVKVFTLREGKTSTGTGAIHFNWMKKKEKKRVNDTKLESGKEREKRNLNPCDTVPKRWIPLLNYNLCFSFTHFEPDRFILAFNRC